MTQIPGSSWCPTAARVSPESARVITDHAELDALPVGTIVMDSPYPDGDVYQRTREGFWAEPGFEGLCTSRVLSLPATVLWTPEATE